MKRILIVEDDVYNAKLLELMLKQSLECEVIINERGSEALKIIADEERPIDMLLLDLHLPELSGEEVLRRVRELPQGKNIPILIISIDDFDQYKYLEMGADDFFLKPFKPDVLMEKINLYLAD